MQYKFSQTSLEEKNAHVKEIAVLRCQLVPWIDCKRKKMLACNAWSSPALDLFAFLHSKTHLNRVVDQIYEQRLQYDQYNPRWCPYDLVR
uniref:Uncharacterized protein n=1 Tax=Romanomermis culicivorax TaxID=13658 RepID=A0A915KE14_ROMCU